jgi:hypothetical protein
MGEFLAQGERRFPEKSERREHHTYRNEMTNEFSDVQKSLQCASAPKKLSDKLKWTTQKSGVSSA